MAARLHTYRVTVEWTGNRGAGTATHAGYGRDHVISAGAKPAIAGSSDPSFRGDPARWNPEDLLLASIAACHKLWYLGLCADAGISVISYRDEAEATMTEDADGAGRFIRAVLRPAVTIRSGGDAETARRLHDAETARRLHDAETARRLHDAETARRLHDDAHRYCFIANSLNFPVTCQPAIRVE